MRKVPSCSKKLMREGGSRNVRNIGFLEQDRSNIFVPGGIEQGRAVGPPGANVDRPNFEVVSLVLGHGPGGARMLGLPNSDPSSRVNPAFGLRRFLGSFDSLLSEGLPDSFAFTERRRFLSESTNGSHIVTQGNHHAAFATSVHGPTPRFASFGDILTMVCRFQFEKMGSGPGLLLLRRCLQGETQIWLGDLRVVLGLFGFLVLFSVFSLPQFVTVQLEPLRSIRFLSSQPIQITGPSLRASSAIPGK